MSSTGILLIGHGTRCSEGTAEFHQLAQRVAGLWDGGPTVPCFLELQRPAITEAASDLVRQGVDQIIAVPVLLFAAGHALRDIPAVLDQLREAYPNVHFAQSEPLGLHSRLLALSRRRCEEACSEFGDVDPTETMLVMVGRGSLNNEATGDMIRLTTLRARLDPFADATTGFVAMCQPTLGDALQSASEGDFRNVIVQPHLLFRGELSRRIERMVCSWSSQHLARRWLVPKHLGPAREIAEALVDRAASSQRIPLEEGKTACP